MTKWTTQHNYADREKGAKYSDKKKDPEKFGLSEKGVSKVTVPGQSQSIKQLMDRYVKGRPIPQE